MGRKYRFRPDKGRLKLSNYLMPTPKQRKQVLKWSLYTLILVLFSVVQDVLLSRIRVFGATTELIPCAIFVICILEGPQNGSIFALVSALCYLFSGTAPGVYTVVSITFLAIGSAILRQAFLQEGFFACLLCTAGAMVLYELSNFLLGLLLELTIPARFYGFLLTAIFSLVAVPLIYPLAKAISHIGDQAWNK